MTSSWDAIQKRLDSIKLPTANFTICEDPDLRQQLLRAKAAHQQVTDRLAGLANEADPEVKALVQRDVDKTKTDLVAAQKAYDKASVILRFKALERKRLEELQKQHPPTEQEEASGEDFAMDTFAPALLSAASLDGMPVDYAKHCLETWSAADATALWRAAWGVQHQQRTDLGKG